MAKSTSGTRLAREIYDEFLVCKLCFESYKTPKCLSCLHTFCQDCIQTQLDAASESSASYKHYTTDYRKFSCPLCYKTTQLPVGGAKRLTDNFLVSNLSEMVRRQRPSQFPFCDLCKALGGKHREAVSRCLDCDKLLCGPCVTQHRRTHVTENHTLFDVEIEKDIECKEHEGEAIRFYCEVCEACVCVLCTFQDHQRHDVTSFKEAVGRYRTDIEEMIRRCHDKISRIETQIDALVLCEQAVKGVEGQIHDTAIELIKEIRTKEQQLIDELHTIYGSECLDFIDTRKELFSQLQNLRNTCSLTELVVNGKDLELLLLKNDVREKLTALTASVEVRSLPTTITKRVQFNPAAYVDLGNIQDRERPLTFTMRFPRAGTRKEAVNGGASPSPPPPKEIVRMTQATQTDAKLTAEAKVQTDPILRRFNTGPKELSQFSKPAKHY